MKLGVDVLLDDGGLLLKGMTYGMISNPTGVNRDLLPTWQLLKDYSSGRLLALFGPEHGWQGHQQDELAVASSDHLLTGLRVFSLYGEALRKPCAAMLKDLDALVFDIQDVGVRFYTYISTMHYCLESCAENKLRFIVLDRPNPLGGIKMEGTLLESKFRSFLGVASIPTRHAMTVGELARFFNRTVEADLEVVPMQGWQRSYWYDETGLSWILPSPNIPTMDTVTLYPGTCLIEGTNLSEGRGTTKPFEVFGAPWLKAERSAEQLNALDLPGVRFRACYFTPTYGKYYNTLCAGVQVHIVDRNLLQSPLIGLEILFHLIKEYPVDFAWRQDGGDGGRDYPFIDWLLGTDKFRCGLEQGISPRELLQEESGKLADFAEKRQESLIY